jgi:hypothetical protein
MNQQNQTSESGELTSLFGPHTVSEKTFKAWYQEWYQQVVNTTTLTSFFKNNCGYIKKIYFNDYTVQNLLSSVGIKNIQARFVIIDKYKDYEIKTPTFTIILYATDSEGKVCSAYHVGLPEHHYGFSLAEPKRDTDIRDSISDKLARRWIDRWDEITQQQAFPDELFETNYGLLNGYNYVMADFMDALYPPNTNIKNYNIVILLAAHDHIPHYWDDGNPPAEVSTFGLVVAGVDFLHTGIFSGDPVNSYYDLSLPCPPNQ